MLVFCYSRNEFQFHFLDSDPPTYNGWWWSKTPSMWMCGGGEVGGNKTHSSLSATCEIVKPGKAYCSPNLNAQQADLAVISKCYRT